MEKDERQNGSQGRIEGSREPQRASRPAPGKVTRTSKLSPGRGPAVQRKTPAPTPGAAAPRARSRWDLTMDPWMDAAHRGVTALAERGEDVVQAAGPIQAKGQQEGPETPVRLSGQGGGAAMPEAVRGKMETAFGADFSTVRIHEGPQAEAMGALAYTQGTDVHFAPGQYQPESQRGQELLGHELTHVVQQSQGRVAATTQAKSLAVNDEQGLEREADEMGRKAAAGAVMSGLGARDSRPVTARSGPAQRQVVQRQQAPQGAQGAGAAATGGAAVSTGAATAAQPATDGLGTLLAALQSAADAAARQTATTALTTWCREHLVDQDRLRQYLQSNVDNETKTRILGELRAEIGRNEVLLGWSYEGGVTAGGANGWENNGANQGTFPNHYKNAVGLGSASRPNTQPWCTSFAGHTATRLGFEAAPGAADGSMFWSGYRLDLWARTGQALGDPRPRQVTPQDQTVAAEGNSSAIITGAQWGTLYTTLTTLQRQRPAGQSDADFLASQQQAVDEFLAGHATPQAGDMFVHDANNAVHGASHTNMVERYDAETRTIFTMGGNEGHAVGGRRVVLTDPQQVHRLASMVRIGAELYTGLTGGGAAAGAGPAPGQPATTPAPDAAQQSAQASPTQAAGEGPAPDAVAAGAGAGAAGGAVNAQVGPELVQAARDINTRIAAVLHGRGQLQSNDANATVLEWQTGSTTANASTSDN
jgi:Domain of unknown function (DUF4157)